MYIYICISLHVYNWIYIYIVWPWHTQNGRQLGMYHNMSVYIYILHRVFVEYIVIRRLQRSVQQQYDWAVCFKLGKISFCYGMSIGKIMETNMYPSFGGGLKVVGLTAYGNCTSHESWIVKFWCRWNAASWRASIYRNRRNMSKNTICKSFFRTRNP